MSTRTKQIVTIHWKTEIVKVGDFEMVMNVPVTTVDELEYIEMDIKLPQNVHEQGCACQICEAERDKP